MEYTVFIQDLLTRSDELLRRGRDQKLEATTLLMLLSCGFVIPYERLRNWDVGGEGAKYEDFTLLRKFARHVKGQRDAANAASGCFETFGSHEWLHFRNREASFKGESFSKQILPRLKTDFYKKQKPPSLDSAMWIMRNALAHGGAHVVSPGQDPLTPSQPSPIVSNKRAAEISHIYFVAEVDYKVGTEILRSSLESVEYFWKEWVKLMKSDPEELEVILDAA